MALMVPVLLAGPLNAASDYLLELDGVKGESSEPGHAGAIEIQSFSWGIANETSTLPTSGGGGGAGKVIMQDIHFVAKVSKASPLLMLACATGQHIKEATLTCRKAGSDGPAGYYVLQLTDVLIRKVSNSGRGSTAGESLPLEEVSFNYGKITYRYVAEDGTVTVGSTTAPTPQ